MAANFCPTCGTAIPQHSPAGLCPRCLMIGGLESGAAAHPAVAATLASPHPTPPGGFVAPEVADLNRRFPQLEILELLGKGGMGAVYKARQRGLDRFVALKILPPEIGNDPNFAERFTREARALGKLSHPNIVGVYDFGQVDGLYYFLMEFVDGANLRQAIRGGGITAKDALSIVGQICDALQFAHDEGIVHRDIKPENILIDKRGRVKIADFGLAKLLGSDQGEQGLTATHQVMGTLRYMAPEQMEGSKEVDHRADIFSLGVVFYELLTGELPVGRFAPPSKTSGVDVRLDEVVLRALEREPILRYQHASEVKTQVQHIAGLSPEAVQNLFGREYRSKAEIFGWPLLHVAFGIDAKTGKKKIAKGVIAIGDVAIGGLALGGCSLGGIACGGVSAGLISFGGVSIGLLLAIGGCAIGLLAFGGLAIGAVALGGGAVGYYAYGGSALGRYTFTGEYQHPEAKNLFQSFAHDWPQWLMWLGLASPASFGLLYVFIWLVLWLKKDKHETAQRDSALSAKNLPPPVPPAIPAQPWMVVVFAVFNLLLAMAMLLMVAVSDPEFWKSDYVRGWEAWLMFRNGLSFLHAAAIIIASIGLLLWQPWARRLTIGLCVFALAVLIVELPSIARVDLPYELNSLTTEMQADGIPASDAEAVAMVLMIAVVGTAFVFGLLMVVAQLLYFTRPNVIEAFQQDEPATAQMDTRLTTLISEEEHRLSEKAKIAAASELRDDKSIWHDLGVIAGYFLRDATVRFVLGGLAAIVYLICLLMFFSFQGQRTFVDGVSVITFQAGQPSPWLIIKASETGDHNVSVQFFCWANFFALIGVGALLLSRKIEELQKGKAHSMVWHYVIWSLMLAMVLSLGMFNLVTGSQRSGGHKAPTPKNNIGPDTSLILPGRDRNRPPPIAATASAVVAR